LFEWYSYVIFLFSIYALIKFKKLKLPRVITFLPIFEIVTPILVIILSIITFLGIGAPIESLIQTPLHLIIISFMVASIEIVYPIIIFSKKDSIGGGEEPLMNKTAIKPNKRNYLKFGALLLIISIIAFLLMPLFIVDIAAMFIFFIPFIITHYYAKKFSLNKISGTFYKIPLIALASIVVVGIIFIVVTYLIMIVGAIFGMDAMVSLVIVAASGYALLYFFIPYLIVLIIYSFIIANIFYVPKNERKE